MSKDQLKEEGNALFVKKKYGLAALKYTEAIEVDEGNAILYANRAACRLNLKQWAIELDPSYAKGWARLATAHDCLYAYKPSTQAWRKALESLPKENLNASEQKQKAQYEEGLKVAEAKLNKPLEPAQVVYYKDNDEHPWVEGRRLVEQYQHTKFLNSSAWLINEAYNDFKEGLDLMNAMVQQKNPRTGELLIQSRNGALLTNGLLLDKRVFHATGNFFDLYNKQAQSECNTVRAWTSTGPEGIMRELPERLAREGWSSVRPALSVTLRCWIMRAHIDAGLQHRYDIALEFFTRIIQVLTWGRETYKDVPNSEKGVIFADTFIVGVRKLYLDTIIGAYSEKPDKQLLQDLYEEAEEVMKEVEKLPSPANTVGGIGPGFFLGFYLYPKSDAQAAFGYYHAKQAALPGITAAAAKDHWTKSISAYIQAADFIPEDDEQHPWYLNVALEYMDKIPTNLESKLRMYERIRLSLPKADKIWHGSAHSKAQIKQHYQRLAEIEQDLRNGLIAGKWTLDSVVTRDRVSS
ncbi:hypothetical protein BD626DRAFT_546575 [Schizophyllum amplum]|uniref:TPR-like protein n=1 Tax=Schizophyllum amplum TaxID=97359 RepID=A0A550CNE2_9AGAR|nr:hypothetical protein BD626DRAFT_546575 [Auriculariopsis ampla]